MLVGLIVVGAKVIVTTVAALQDKPLVEIAVNVLEHVATSLRHFIP